MFIDSKILLRHIWQYRTVRHITSWVLPYVVFLLLVMAYETPEIAFGVATSLFLPAPLAVYLHFAALKRFFEKRRYVLYGISLVASIAISAAFTEVLHPILVNDPNSNTSGVGAALLAITLSTGFYYFGRGVRQQYRLQEIEAKQATTELALLRSQLHPHFLFNTLNNLYAMALDKSDQMPDVILRLSDLLRYTLDSAEQNEVPLADEISFLENYYALEELRISGNPDLEMEISGIPGTLTIGPMLLVPFVENAFKHSNLGTTGKCYLHINLAIQTNHLTLTVDNTFNKNLLNERSGTGMDNVRKRLNLLHPGQHNLQVTSQNGLYHLKLELELKE